MTTKKQVLPGSVRIMNEPKKPIWKFLKSLSLFVFDVVCGVSFAGVFLAAAFVIWSPDTATALKLLASSILWVSFLFFFASAIDN